MRQEKRKKREEKAKSKSQDCCVTFKPKNLTTEILLSAHAPTSQASMDQRAASLRSKRFLASSSRKLQGREQEKKRNDGGGEVVVSFSS